METRKVQLSGGTTYTVSIPKTWATEQGIEAGQRLHLHPDEHGRLVVETDDRSGGDERVAEVDVSTCDERAIAERVRALYAVGTDRIVLVDRTGHPVSRRRTVSSVVSDLTGLEVLEATGGRIVLSNLVVADHVSVRKRTLRLHLVALAMHRDAVTAVLDGDADLAEQVIGRDAEADRLFALLTRSFRRAQTDLSEVSRLGLSRADLFEYYYVGRQFERVADHAEKTARLAREHDHPLPEPLSGEYERLATRARSVVTSAAEGILSDAEPEATERAIRDCETLVDDVETAERALYDLGDPAAAHTAGLLFDSVRRTAEYGANVAEMMVQRAVRG